MSKKDFKKLLELPYTMYNLLAYYYFKWMTEFEQFDRDVQIDKNNLIVQACGMPNGNV